MSCLTPQRSPKHYHDYYEYPACCVDRKRGYRRRLNGGIANAIKRIIQNIPTPRPPVINLPDINPELNIGGIINKRGAEEDDGG